MKVIKLRAVGTATVWECRLSFFLFLLFLGSQCHSVDSGPCQNFGIENPESLREE